MSVAIPSREGLVFLGPSMDSGISADAQNLAKFVFDSITHFKQTTPKENAFASLDEVYTECSIQNWDGYGAQPVKEEAYLEARKILDLLPSNVPLPEVGSEPNGDIGLEWSRSRRSVFVISVSGHNVMTYAGLFGRNEIHGSEYFEDSIPSMILQNLSRLYSYSIDH